MKSGSHGHVDPRLRSTGRKTVGQPRRDFVDVDAGKAIKNIASNRPLLVDLTLFQKKFDGLNSTYHTNINIHEKFNKHKIFCYKKKID